MKTTKRFLLVGLMILFTGFAQAAPAEKPWWNDRVFYEIFVRSFYDSDGDGTGDLRGVIEKLDYLNDGDPTTTSDLGVTGLWLMPVAQSPSYHGYDVMDYHTIEEDYGTNEDFRALIEAAHARGIAVIVDLVLNHTSAQHPWFIASATGPESEYADYYVWSDTNPGFNGPNNQRVWHPFGSRFYYGLFWDQMPDLNYANPAVSQEMYDVTRFWLEEMGVDGFRLDAVKHLIEQGDQQEHTSATLAWLGNYRAFVKTVNPDALLVGEVWSGSRSVAEYVPDKVDLAFEFDLAATMIDGVRRRSRSALESIQSQVLELYPPGQYAAFLTNHDQNRVMSEFREDVGAAKVAATLLLTNPGVPFVYYGEEIGMTGQKPDERIRTPMQWSAEERTAGFTAASHPWQPLDESYETANVAAQTDDPDSLLSHYRRLIHLRNNHVALRYGDMLLVESSKRPVYAFIRQTPDEMLLVLVNMNHREIDDYTLTLAEGGLTGVESAELLFGEGDAAAPIINAAGGFDEYAPLPILPPRSSFIIQFK